MRTGRPGTAAPGADPRDGEWDYVVVGAGSAGAALAGRLTEDPSCRVVVLEAGPDWRSAEATAVLRGADALALMDAAAFPQYQWPGLTARRTAVQEPAPMVRGRGVGGSSIVNGQAAIRPPLGEFATWVAMGCTGWGADDVLPFFVALEDDLDFFDPPYHGRGGPLPLSRPAPGAEGAWDAAFREAAVSAGYPWAPDHNAPGALGVSPFAWNARDGRRVTTNDAYLEPARGRPNLTVVGGALVDRVVFHGTRALGVRVRIAGAWREVRAGRTVLCAGPAFSPAILQRSGVGRPELLARLGLPVVSPAPAGEGLQDHPVVRLWVGLPDERLAAGQRQMNSVLRYTSGLAGSGPADIQTNVMRSVADPARGGVFVHAWQCTSRGQLAVPDADPESMPVVDERMLETADDRARMRRALRDAGALLASAPVRRLVVGASGADRLVGRRAMGDAELDEMARRTAADSAHISGTCRMGHPGDPHTVVDPQCAVVGTGPVPVTDTAGVLAGGPEAALAALTLPTVVDHVGRETPDAEALVAPEGRLTYGRFAEEVRHLASWLGARGLEPGDRVTVLFPNGLRWMVATYAALRAGCTVVPLNTWYGPDELASALDRARVRLAVVCDEEAFGRDFAGILDDLAAGGGTGAGRLALGVHRWPAGEPRLPAAGAGLPAPDRSTADGVAFILFTSGSTNLPKGVLLPHRSIVRSGYAIGERQGFVAGDRMWLPNPLFFSKGCVNAVPAALTHGVTLLLQARFDPEAALELLSAERCTIYYGGSVHARRIVDHPRFADHDLSSLRIGTGGATPQEKALMIDVLGIPGLASVYGLTECCGYSCVTGPGDPRRVRIETQGRVIDSQELRIADGERPLRSGETGEIQLRGAILSSYLDAEMTERAFLPGGWFRTNDLGWLDDEHRLHFVGRMGEMIKTNGINVSPAQVEEVVRAVEGVREVYVFGVSDEEAGELVACVVVASDESLVSGDPARRPARTAPLAAAAAGAVRGRLASYNVPWVVEVLSFDELPLTLSGKVSRRLLRQRAEGARAGSPPTASTA